MKGVGSLSQYLTNSDFGLLIFPEFECFDSARREKEMHRRDCYRRDTVATGTPNSNPNGDSRAHLPI